MVGLVWAGVLLETGTGSGVALCEEGSYRVYWGQGLSCPELSI